MLLKFFVSQPAPFKVSEKARRLSSRAAHFLFPQTQDGGESAMNVAKGLGIGFGGPTAVHLIGTFAINNFGGLGGGL